MKYQIIANPVAPQEDHTKPLITKPLRIKFRPEVPKPQPTTGLWTVQNWAAEAAGKRAYTAPLRPAVGR